MAHTKGPWHMDSVDRVRTNTGVVIARCERNEHHEYMDEKEQSANARLLSAAPDLLAACEGLLKALNIAFDRCDGDLLGVAHNDAIDTMTLAEAAIAKAKGGA